jgi:hypothetical protein
VAEHLGDLGQGDTDLDHLAGKRVAKPVCPNYRHAHRTTPEIPFVPRGPIGATTRRNTSRCTAPFGRPLRR